MTTKKTNQNKLTDEQKKWSDEINIKADQILKDMKDFEVNRLEKKRLETNQMEGLPFLSMTELPKEKEVILKMPIKFYSIIEKQAEEQFRSIEQQCLFLLNKLFNGGQINEKPLVIERECFRNNNQDQLDEKELIDYIEAQKNPFMSREQLQALDNLSPRNKMHEEIARKGIERVNNGGALITPSLKSRLEAIKGFKSEDEQILSKTNLL